MSSHTPQALPWLEGTQGHAQCKAAAGGAQTLETVPDAGIWHHCDLHNTTSAALQK